MAAEFRINKEYADHYNKFREKEELQKLKDKYGDRDQGDSTSESDEEFADAHNPLHDHQWQKTLQALKSKDPKIYDKGFSFFNEEDENMGKGAKKGKKKKAEKPYTVSDMKREAVLKKMKKFDENNEVESSSEEEADLGSEVKSKSYVAEQAAIKESFKPLVSDDDDDDGSDLFVEKSTPQEFNDNVNDPYFDKWVKELESQPKIKDTPAEVLDRSSMSGSDQLMMRFLSNKGYEDEGEQHFFKDDIKKQSSEVEDEFRNAGLEHHSIKRHARDNPDSMRRKDDSRSRKRKDLKERKEKEKQQKAEELKRLKNLKRKEIMEKIDHLKRITGNDNVGFTEEDIEGNFNAKEYDEMMQRVFDREYYGDEEGEGQMEKPVFDDDDIEWNEENWDDWTAEGQSNGNSEEYELHCEDPDFNMDADYDPDAPTQPQPTESKKKRKKKSKFTKALEKQKPVFDPENKTFEEYFDEYYKLDYEDMIGDTPCRFKYRTTLENDYGLTVGEVLKADDKDLNKWVSVKRITSVKPMEEEVKDQKSYRKRGRKQDTKLNVMASLRDDQKEETEPKLSKKQLKKLRQQALKEQKEKETTSSDLSVQETSVQETSVRQEAQQQTPQKLSKSQKKRQKKKLNKQLRQEAEGAGSPVISDQRDSSKLIDATLSQAEPDEIGDSEKIISGQKEKSKRKDKPKNKPKKKTIEGENNEGDLIDNKGAIKELLTQKRKRPDTEDAEQKKKRRKMDKKKLKNVSDQRLLAYGINPNRVKYSDVAKRNGKKMKNKPK